MRRSKQIILIIFLSFFGIKQGYSQTRLSMIKERLSTFLRENIPSKHRITTQVFRGVFKKYDEIIYRGSFKNMTIKKVTENKDKTIIIISGTYMYDISDVTRICSFYANIEKVLDDYEISCLIYKHPQSVSGSNYVEDGLQGATSTENYYCFYPSQCSCSTN